MKSRVEIEQAWSAHLQRPFPRELVGREIDGVCLTSCDTYLAGCVSHFVDGGALDPERADVVARVSADIRRVLPHLSGEASEYFSALLALGAALQVVAKPA